MGSQPESNITLPASNQRAASKLSAMPKNLNITHPDEARLPRLPDSIDQPITAMPQSRMTDVASSIEVSDFFTLEPLQFDVMAATDYIEKCTTCVESEDLCDILEEILVTLDDADSDVPNTPERLRLVNLVQWTALKCSRRSIRLQNTEFKLYVRDMERFNRTPIEASPASQQKRKQAKRQPVSPQKDIPSKKQAKSERKLPPTPTSPRHIGDDASSMEDKWHVTYGVPVPIRDVPPHQN
ncbi:hypothetical protein TNCV_4668851 [Trichonephila clavipes]|nr:hypothetical protein TNCV_4668851 [Trichonephila clavipes]